MKDGSAGRLCLSVVSDPTLLSGLYHTLLYHTDTGYGTRVFVSFRTSYGLERSSALVQRRNLRPYKTATPGPVSASIHMSAKVHT